MSEAYEYMIKEVIEEKLDCKKGKGRKIFYMIDELKDTDSYQAMKKNAEGRDAQRNCY